MANNVKLPIIIALVIAGILACSVYIYFQIMGGMSSDDPPPTVSPPPPEAPPPVEQAPAPELPALDASDQTIRSLVEALSEHPKLAAWLAPDNLVRRFVAAVVNVANDESPRPHIGHLAPSGNFRVNERHGSLAIDPASYARYDTATAVLDSLDDEQAQELYRHLKPLLDEAYQELGYPGGDFDVALGRAIDRLLATPIPAGRVIVKKRVKNYRFADPDLEALSPIEKHLIRMGPANARKVQAKLRRLREALPQ